MAANLDPLIRVRKHEVEQKQKALSALYEQAEGLKNQRDTLQTELAIETEKSRDMDAELMSYFVAYAAKVQKEVENIDLEREKLETRIQMMQDLVRDAFADLKKVEIIQERRKAEEQTEIDKKESDVLDEIALDGFRRNKDG